MTDRWMDNGRTEKTLMLLSHTLTMWESDTAVWLNSAQWFRRRLSDGQMDGRRTHGKIINVALAHPYHVGK